MILDTFTLLFNSNADEVAAKQKKLTAAEVEYQTALKKGGVDAMRANQRRLTAEKELLDAQRKQKDQADDLNKSYEGIVGSVTAIAAAYFGISSIKQGLFGSQEFLSNLEMQSKWLGINGKELAAWQGVLQSVGGTAGDFDNAIKGLHDSYVRAGLNVNGGQLIENLLKLSDLMHNNPNQAEAIGLRFGFSEPMILALQKGRGEIEKILASQKEINGVTDKGEDAARAFSTEWQKTETYVRGVYATLEGLILPTLTKILAQINEKGIIKATTDFIGDQNERGKARRAIMQQKGVGWNDVDPADIDAYIAAQHPQSAQAATSNGSGNTLGFKNNNPGNLQPGGVEASYPTVEAGLAAMANNLRSYGRKGWNTIEQIAKHWAPAGGKGNSAASEEAYKRALEKALGKSRYAVLDMNDENQLDGLMHAMITQENGSDPYSDAAVRKSIMAGKGLMKTSSSTPFNSSVPSQQGGGDKSVSIEIKELNVKTQATDADGISKEIGNTLTNQLRVTASNWDDGVLA